MCGRIEVGWRWMCGRIEVGWRWGGSGREVMERREGRGIRRVVDVGRESVENEVLEFLEVHGVKIGRT